LNCNAEIHGRFCHVCGQENIEPVESAWHLVTHFFKDITHFDGKFFSTGKYLIFKPGFVSKEYMIGRRTSYLNPVRMYVFTSAIFFLIFFSFNKENEKIIDISVKGKTLEQIDAMDSTSFDAFSRLVNKGKPMTREGFKAYVDSSQQQRGIHFTTSKYASKAAYDSVLQSGKKKHNWLERQLIYKELEVNEKYKNNQGQILKAFTNNLMHSFPQMLFISLPLFALMLKLLYRRRKEYYYANHAIFSIHLYVFVFIILLIMIGLEELSELLHWEDVGTVMGFLLLGILFYEYKAMRNFYEQRRGKTILKFILLNLSMLVIMMILFTIFILLSLMKV
jgi:hypothetical protein